MMEEPITIVRTSEFNLPAEFTFRHGFLRNFWALVPLCFLLSMMPGFVMTLARQGSVPLQPVIVMIFLGGWLLLVYNGSRLPSTIIFTFEFDPEWITMSTSEGTGQRLRYSSVAKLKIRKDGYEIYHSKRRALAQIPFSAFNTEVERDQVETWFRQHNVSISD